MLMHQQRIKEKERKKSWINEGRKEELAFRHKS
jgi:hypothetical protein